MTPSRPADLPDFETPPVIEVVLGIQFDPIAGFASAHSGLVWQRFRDQFPRVEDKAPLDPVREEFGGTPPGIAPFRLEFLDRPPSPRVWFLNTQGTELVQLQRDRIVHNWRKVVPGDTYPRYEKIKVAFRADTEMLQEVLAENALDPIRPNQWEITYVNHIALPLHEGATTFGQLEGVIAPWSGQHSDGFLGPPEDIRLSVRQVIRDGAERPVGRLHVGLQPGLRPADKSQVLILTLTARGQPTEATLDAAFDGLDIGREEIVRGFTSITTHQAHRKWGRKDA